MANQKRTRELLNIINVMPKSSYDETARKSYDAVPKLNKDSNIMENDVRMEGTVAETGQVIFFTVNCYTHSIFKSPRDIVKDGQYLVKGCQTMPKGKSVDIAREDGTSFEWKPEVDTILGGTAVYKGALSIDEATEK